MNSLQNRIEDRIEVLFAMLNDLDFGEGYLRTGIEKEIYILANKDFEELEDQANKTEYTAEMLLSEGICSYDYYERKLEEAAAMRRVAYLIA